MSDKLQTIKAPSGEATGGRTSNLVDQGYMSILETKTHTPEVSSE